MNLPSDGSPDSALAAFWQQARQYTPRTRQLRAVAHSRAQASPGDVWLTQTPDVANGEPTEPLTVLLLERFEGEAGEPTLFTTAPIFSDPSMAGPADAVLPREILGFEAGIAFASAASVLSESLMTCEGALPEDWISRLTAFHDYVRDRTANPPLGIVTGAPYLDENDPAFIFHENLAEQMQALATPALEWATMDEHLAEVQNDPVPQWRQQIEQSSVMKPTGRRSGYMPSSLAELALAASSGIPPTAVETLLVGNAASIELVEQVGQPHVYRALVTTDPLKELSGAEILSGDEQSVLARFIEGEDVATAKFPGHAGILVRLADGRVLMPRKEEE
jgi:hypothetical protein